MITEAKRRFPVRITGAIPAGGFGQASRWDLRVARRELRRRWLGHDPSRAAWGRRDAVAIYFPDTTLAGAFVARWCAGQKPETEHGAFRFREDAPMPRRVAVRHKSPP